MKYLIFADVHLDLNSTSTSVELGYNPSADVFRLVLEEAREKNGQDLDAILMLGDYVKHNMTSVEGLPPIHWPEQIETMKMVIHLIEDVFPLTPIIPVIGNNDVMFDHNAPSILDAPLYY